MSTPNHLIIPLTHQLPMYITLRLNNQLDREREINN